MNLQDGFDITVSRDHLKFGECESHHSCPIALVIAEQLSIEEADRNGHIWVGTSTLRVRQGDTMYVWEKKHMSPEQFREFKDFVKLYDSFDGKYSDEQNVLMDKMQGTEISFGKPKLLAIRAAGVNPTNGTIQ